VSVTLDAQKPYTIELFNATGVSIRQIKTAKSEVLVDLSDLQSGLYFIQVRNAYDRVLTTEKVVKL
jgi:hypothetical protein